MAKKSDDEKAPKKSPRPKSRPKSDDKMAPKKSPRPPSRPKGLKSGPAVAAGNNAARRRAKEDDALYPENMAKGGKVRGMGAAKRGGKFTRSA